jgi:anti-anti-sigma factor
MVGDGGFDAVATLDLTEDEARSDAVCLRLRGELDLGNAYTFDRRLLAVESRKPALILLDLRELTMLDSAGLARIIAAQRRARRGGWRLVLVRGGRVVQRVLRISGVSEMLEITSDPEAVISAMP